MPSFNIPQPEFFDIFGLGVFSFIIALGVWGLKSEKPLPRWSLFVLLGIGAAGFLVDGYTVFTVYLR